uniref:Uncharacterized protein n=1 Tax=Propithecus coquereli TaxID=379532 RepID=A0A2K6FAA2_PROCO
MVPLHKDSWEEEICPSASHFFRCVCLTQHVQRPRLEKSGCTKPKPWGGAAAGACPGNQKQPCVLAERVRRGQRTLEERLSHRGRKLRKDMAELCGPKAQEEEKLQALQFQVDRGNHKLEAELESQHQTRGRLGALPQQRLDQSEDVPAEVVRILEVSRAAAQLSSLVTDLERTAKEPDARTLQDFFVSRGAPQKLDVLYPELEKRVSESLLQPPPKL